MKIKYVIRYESIGYVIFSRLFQAQKALFEYVRKLDGQKIYWYILRISSYVDTVITIYYSSFALLAFLRDEKSTFSIVSKILRNDERKIFASNFLISRLSVAYSKIDFLQKKHAFKKTFCK